MSGKAVCTKGQTEDPVIYDARGQQFYKSIKEDHLSIMQPLLSMRLYLQPVS